MVMSMATSKVTITLPDRHLAEIRKRVASRRSASISGFIQQSVEKTLQAAPEFRAMVEQSLEATGGPLTAREKAWARKLLSPKPRRVV
jgi:Arc/MetJ-type ribon-helix-helix transcriptional regulator